MKRWHLTAQEKKRIRELTRKRVRQSEIAHMLGIGRDTVALWQKRMKLPTRPPIPENKILQLFRQGLGGYRIARRLGLPVGQVFRVAHKNNFRHKHNTGLADPEANVAGFIEAIKNREDHIVALAEKFHIGKVKANRLAHEVLRTFKFRPGRSKPVLSSAFPQRHFGPNVRRRSER